MTNSAPEWDPNFAPRLTTPDALANYVQRRVLSGEMPAGEKLPPERQLADMLKVSRSTLREALQVLEMRGIVDRAPGRGTTVRSLTESANANALMMELSAVEVDLAYAMELRGAIEPPIAALAAERATAMDVAQLEQLLIDMASAQTITVYAELDRLFHRTIAQYTQNPLFMILVDKAAEYVDVSRKKFYLSRARQLSSHAEHQQIVMAIARHDPAAASAAAKLHVESVLQQIGHLAKHSERT